jgi:hypothetical protein
MQRLNIQRILLLVVLCLSLLLANATTPKETTITCKVYNNTGTAMFLYKVENGEAVKLGSYRRPGTMDTCMFSFPIEKEGVYYIQKAGGKGATYNHVIYLKPGDNKSVDLYNSKLGLDFDSSNVLRPNQETIILQRWTNMFNTVCKLGTNRAKRDEYIIAYNKLVEQASELQQKAISNNPYFKQLLAAKIATEIQYAKAAAFFYYGERMNSRSGQRGCTKAVLSITGRTTILRCWLVAVRTWLDVIKIQYRLPALPAIRDTGTNAGNFIC